MTELRPLTILLERNERERDAAITAHQRAQAASRAAVLQFDQLQTYRRDYGQRWSTQFKQQGQMQLVHCYQSFLERLTLAVDQQQQVAEYAEQEVERALVALQAAELRCASVRKLIERRLLEQRLAAERRDQKQTDEAATRAAWTRIGASPYWTPRPHRMISFNPSSTRSLPALDAGAPGHAGPNALTTPNADPAGFASLLRQNQMAPPAPAPMPTVQARAPVPSPTPAPNPAPAAPHADAPAQANPAKPEHAAPAQNEHANSAHAAGHPQGPSKGKARDVKTAEVPVDRTASANAGAAPLATQDATATKTAPNAGADSTLDPSVMQWLNGMQAKPETPVAKADPAAATGSPDEAAQAAAGDTRGAAGAHRPLPDLKAEDAAERKATLDPRPDASPAVFAALLTKEREGPAPAGPHSTVEGMKDTAAAGAAAASNAFSPTPGAAAPAAPTPVAVATPVTAPDFAQELGVHLSVLAKDGVQHAELHLNPADMGPVSVQIVMDGTQAHVAFGADMAATRHAIEAGMHQLAGALADAGFTLAGGGVSQHAGGRGEGGGQGRPPSGAARSRTVSADAVGKVSTAARRAVTKGGVDLFA